MTNPTSNFGWQMPTNTDLVTDLPADFEVFGQAVDTSLADLKGGTTGQILAKTSATDMDFTWIANDQGDITGVTAGTGITVTSPTGPVPTVSINTAVTADLTTSQTLTNKTLTSPVLTTPSISNINAKGDILVGTADNTLGIITAGNNGETLLADSSTSTGLRYQGSMAAGKNFAINGNFDVWQRGTSFAAAAVSAYTADRWQVVSGTQTATISQQTTGAPNGSRYVLRNAYTSAASYGNFFQGVETNNALQLSGKVVTFSIKMRKNATLTTDLNIVIAKSATVDAAYSATWTTIQSTTVANASLPTGTTSADWYTASVTATIPNDGTANTLRIGVAEVSTQPSGAYWEISQAQLELGSVATAFTRTGGNIQGELAACQRYYFRYDPSATGTTIAFSRFGFGAANTTGAARVQIQNPTTMRVGPSTLDYNTNIKLFDGVTAYAQSSIVIDTSSPLQTTLFFTPTAASLTAFRPYWLYPDGNTAAYVGLSAEL